MIEGILDETITILKRLPDNAFIDKTRQDFEPFLVEKLDAAINNLGINDTSTELISGSKFPDIVVKIGNEKYGVEVKTTTGDKWESLGGSIFESTRIEGLKDIYVFFAKFGGNIDFKAKRHEDCVSNVKITHKPRYIINMEVEPDETIFDKVGVTYEEVSKSQQPFDLFRSYLKEQAGPGADLWWISDEESTAPSAVITYESLSNERKDQIRYELLALFPQIFGSAKTKFLQPSTYLAAKHGVVVHCLRDKFSAGGQLNPTFDGKSYTVPKVFKFLINDEDLKGVENALGKLPNSVIKEYWGESVPEEKLMETWLKKVSSIVEENGTEGSSELREVVSYIVQRHD